MGIVRTEGKRWKCPCASVSEHRAGTNRAWCLDCGEWCYPWQLCMRGVQVEVGNVIYALSIQVKDIYAKLRNVRSELLRVSNMLDMPREAKDEEKEE